VGLILYFARGQEAVLVLPVVGIVLFIAGVIYNRNQQRANSYNPQPFGYLSIRYIVYLF